MATSSTLSSRKFEPGAHGPRLRGGAWRPGHRPQRFGGWTPAGGLAATLDQLLAELGARGTHNYISTGAGRIHALEVGEGPRPLVFLHGLGASAGSYRGLITQLAKHRRVIAIDRPGSGLSDAVRFRGHPRSAWNQVVAEVADALGVDRFDLVGHSLGGLAAGGFAVDNPDRVRDLVLLAPVGLSPRVPAGWAVAMVPGIMDILWALDRREMSRQVARDEPDIRGLSWGPVKVGEDLVGYRYAVSKRFGRGSDLDMIPRLMRPFRFHPDSLLLPGLGLLADRTLVVWGDHDEQVALSPAREQLAAYPRIELKVLSDRGHLFPFEEPGPTASLITTWLASH
ncbi:MAG: alpha/beta fold hydrolase [Candidatus Dormibacteria bacterium]